VELCSGLAAPTWLSEHQCDPLLILLFADNKSSYLPSACQPPLTVPINLLNTEQHMPPSQAGQPGHPVLGGGIHKTIRAPHKFPRTGRMTSISFVELATTGTRCLPTPQKNPGYFFPEEVT